jgi:hypothetical protein
MPITGLGGCGRRFTPVIVRLLVMVGSGPTASSTPRASGPHRDVALGGRLALAAWSGYLRHLVVRASGIRSGALRASRGPRCFDARAS